MNERVGEVFKSEWKQEQDENPQLIIDGGVCASAENTRFCLAKVGRSIGKGIRLNQKDENIYLECLSDSAVFVQCPLFARKNGDELATVYRLKASDASTSSSNGSTSCPMWIEVQFPRPLQILDEVLMENADEIGGEEVHSFS
uniref:MH2 domain-containing protein n=1 Tax=Meloidogyne hapla TaxID=6305 RepID=A0A1I8BEY2_MELHA